MSTGGPIRRTKLRLTENTRVLVDGIQPRSQAGQRISRAVFTLNNWTEEELKYLKEEFAPQTTWMVIGKEEGEEGTPHLQGPFSPIAHGMNPICKKCGYRHCDPSPHGKTYPPNNELK